MEVPRKSIKEMKETIQAAGLPVADLLEREHIQERYAKALARLAEAARLKKKRTIAPESDDDSDGSSIGLESSGLIPPKSGQNVASKVSNPFGRVPKKAKFQEFAYKDDSDDDDDDDEVEWTSRVKDNKTKARNKAKAEKARKAARLRKAPPPKKKKGSFVASSDESDESSVGSFIVGDDEEEEESDEELSLPDDDEPEPDYDDRRARMDALAAKRRAGAQRAAPRGRAPPVQRTPHAPVAVDEVSPDGVEAIDVDAEPPAPIEIPDTESDEEGVDDDDDDAPRRRADRLIRGCGAYADRLLAELRRAGLAAETRGGALAAAAMDAPADGAAPAAPANPFGTDGSTAAAAFDVDAPAAADAGFRALDAAEVAATCGGALTLKAHQLVGVNWLLLLERVGACGVLADDMGLGKTIQTIAYLAASRRRRRAAGRAGPNHDVVVVPASTLGNWSREFKRFAPREKVAIYHGSQAERLALQRDPHVRGADVVLTTYTWWERDSCEADRAWFAARAPWAHVVLDEGHALKNPDASRSKRLRALGSPCRTILSGTPIMNRPLDLLSLLLFLMPALFRECGVTDRLDEVLEHLEGEGGVARLRALLAPFCLRRVKADVLQSLPAKRAVTRSVQLDAAQRKAYLDVVGRSVAKAPPPPDDLVCQPKNDLVCAPKRSKKPSAPRKPAYTEETRAKHLFTELRKAANHPLLLRLDKFDAAAIARIARECSYNGHFGTHDAARVAAELETYDDFRLHEICREYEGRLGDLALTTDALFESAKCRELRELLPRLKAEGHRMLLFSQWTRLLDLLGLLCDDVGLRYARLDGQTPISERQGMVAAFNEGTSDVDVFLLSTRAGGLGINLTGADTVIIHDVDFNPEVDRQAEDRAHRIGQTKPVTVYRLVAEETVDRDILDLAAKKRALNERVMAADPDEVLAEDGDVPGKKSIAEALAKAMRQYQQARAD